MTQYTPKAAIPYAELTDAANLQTYTQALATVLDSAVVPVYPTRTDRDAANPAPSTGDVCFVSADLREYRYFNGQWNNQTPLNASASISFTTLASTFVTVTFPIAFEFTPYVLPNIDSGSGATAGWCSRATSVTTTNFSLYLFSSAGSTATWSSIPVKYTAF
jgi:hypothetical protein